MLKMLTIVLLKCLYYFRLLTIQSHQLTIRQKYYITKLVSLYMGSMKVNYTNNDRIFTVDDLIDKSKNQHQSQWSLAIGKLIFKYYK